MGGIIVSLRQLAPSSCGERIGVEHNLDIPASRGECGSDVAGMGMGEGTGTGTGTGTCMGKELAVDGESDICD